jgi:hypothetical protein
VKRTFSPAVKAPPKTAGICLAPDATPTTWVCRGGDSAYQRHSLVKQEDFYFPCVGLTARLAAASLRLSGEPGTDTIPIIAKQRQVGPRCGHDTWGTSFYDGFPPLAGPRVFTTGSPAAATLAHRPDSRPLRPPCRLRSLLLGPMRAPTTRPTRILWTECGSSQTTAWPLPPTVRPHRGRTFNNGPTG